MSELLPLSIRLYKTAISISKWSIRILASILIITVAIKIAPIPAELTSDQQAVVDQYEAMLKKIDDAKIAKEAAAQAIIDAQIAKEAEIRDAKIAKERAETAKAYLKELASGGVRVGMSTWEVEHCNWGKPYHKTKTYFGGDLVQTWSYKGGSSLSFKNDRLAIIWNAG